MTECIVDGCYDVARCRGMCHAHYSRWYRTGDVQAHIPVVRYRTADGCPLCDEAEFARDNRAMTPDELCRAARIQPRSLLWHLQRHDRPDLAEWARPAANADRARRRHDTCRTCEESTWAMDNAVTPQEVARALGLQLRSMIRHFQRNQRTDLADWVRSAASTEDRHYRRTTRERDHATD